MPPRSFTNPPPKTESAREARQAFFCALCNKGYARQNEFAAHESSYDHQHKKRLKDLKAMNKTMDNSASKARRNEEKGSGLIKIAAIGQTGAKKDHALENASDEGGIAGSGFKKGGFKKAFGGVVDSSHPSEAEPSVEFPTSLVPEVGRDASDDPVFVESDTDEELYEHYDPRKPTDCSQDCKGWTLNAPVD